MHICQSYLNETSKNDVYCNNTNELNVHYIPTINRFMLILSDFVNMMLKMQANTCRYFINNAIEWKTDLNVKYLKSVMMAEVILAGVH